MGIEELIAHARVWRGSAHGSALKTVATGYPALDRFLPGGGWPRDAVTEVIFERHGSGELSLVMPALAAMSRRDGDDKRWIVWIAPPLLPYAPALVQNGLDLDRVLLVHPRGARKDALWAAEQAIRSGSSIAILAWLERATDAALRRLQLGAEQRECLTVLFRPLEALGSRSPAALRLKLAPARHGAYRPVQKSSLDAIEGASFSGKGRRQACACIGAREHSEPAPNAAPRLFHRPARIEVLKCRGGHPGVVDVDLGFVDGSEPCARGGVQEDAGCPSCR